MVAKTCITAEAITKSVSLQSCVARCLQSIFISVRQRAFEIIQHTANDTVLCNIEIIKGLVHSANLNNEKGCACLDLLEESYSIVGEQQQALIFTSLEDCAANA